MKLSKKAFSRRLQELVLGKHTDYASNICNHFWLTVFALSCVTIFLPISLVALAVSSFADYLEVRSMRIRDEWFERGKKLTIEQVFSLMQSLGWAHYTNKEFYVSKSIGYASRWSGKKKSVMLRGWMLANEDWQHQLNEHAAKMNNRYLTNFSVKKIAVGMRTIIASYTPTLYWSLTLAASFLAALMASGYVWVDLGGSGELAWVSAVAVFFIVGLVTLVASVYIYLGSDDDGLVLSFVDKYSVDLKDDVFISYFKAAKKKVCPLIEWTD